MVHEAFNPDISDIKSIAFKYNGNIAAISKHYKVSRETVYQYLKRNDAKSIIDEVRRFNDEYQLDLAEFIFMHNMSNYQNNPGLAQRAAEKVIDKKGHKRGWEQSQIDSSDYSSKMSDEIAN